RLRIISSFSHDLSVAVHRQDRSECQIALKTLLKRYGPTLPIKESEIPAILEAAIFETADTFRAAQVSMDRVSMRQQIAAATGVDEPSAGYEQAAPRCEQSADVLKNLLKEVSAVL